MTEEKAKFIVDVLAISKSTHLRLRKSGTSEAAAAEKIADRYAQFRQGMCFQDASDKAIVEFLMSID